MQFTDGTEFESILIITEEKRNNENGAREVKFIDRKEVNEIQCGKKPAQNLSV